MNRDYAIPLKQVTNLPYTKLRILENYGKADMYMEMLETLDADTSDVDKVIWAGKDEEKEFWIFRCKLKDGVVMDNCMNNAVKEESKLYEPFIAVPRAVCKVLWVRLTKGMGEVEKRFYNTKETP